MFRPLIAVLFLGALEFRGTHLTACGPPEKAPDPKRPDEPKSCPVPPDPCQKCAASPRFAAFGNYVAAVTDLQIPTAGLPLTVTRTYDSARPYDGLFGPGWSSNLSTRLFYATYLFAAPSTYKKEAVITMPDGGRYRYTENASGTTYTAPLGRYDMLVKNGNGTFTLTVQRSRIRYQFSATGQLTAMTDAYGNTLNVTYDGNGRISRIADASGSGRYLDVVYGANGRVSTVQDSSGRQVQYGYASSGALTSVTDPENRITTYSYATTGSGELLSDVTDPWGRLQSEAIYTASCHANTLTENGRTWRYQENYYAANRIAKLDFDDSVTEITFNPDGLITDWKYPEGSQTHTDYYPDGSVREQTDEVGVKTAYVYDARGNVASVTRDFQGAQAVRFDYTYDPAFPDNVTRVTPRNPSTGQINRDWQEWKYDYYQAGSTAPGALFHLWRVKSDGTDDLRATYTYNSKGQITRVTSATGAATDYEYDAAGNLFRLTAPANNDAGTRPVTQYGYDALGRVTSVTDPLGKVTSYTYDGLDRVLTVTLPKPTISSPLDFTTTYSYDNFDAGTGLSFTHVTDPNGKVTKQGYDQFGNLNRVVDASNQVTKYTYVRGLLASIEDANGNVTSYAYDKRHRLETVTFPDGAQERYTYHRDSQVDVRYTRKAWIRYTYDRLKRVTRAFRQNDGPIDYTFVGQKLTAITDTFHGVTENYSFGYDSSYRVSSETQSTRGTVSYTYFPDDGVQTITVASGPSVTYARYPDGSLNTITWSLVPGQFKYRYTLPGQYQSITFPTGAARGFSYDDQGRLIQLTNTDPVAGNLATYAYGYDLNHTTSAYDRLGQRVSVTATVPSQGFNNHQTRYEYDNLYQLTKATYPNVAPFNGEIHSWTYDAIGNRLTNRVNSTTQTYAYQKIGANPNNWQRLLNDGVNAYTYDPDGNVATRTGFTFVWSDEDRLRSISGGVTAGYRYDHQGRRTIRTVSGATNTYLYDGLSLIRETGATPADYLFGPGIDEPLAMVRGAQSYYYATDALGSVGLLTNAGGAVQNSYRYDSWGTLRQQTGSLGNPFGYTAREFGEAGSLFYRARQYGPSIGRFLSEDPIGYTDSGNLYAYAINDPVDLTDPIGLSATGPGSCPPDCTRAAPLPSTSPRCDEYGNSTYRGVSQRCYCKCAGDSAWSQQVRGCLLCEHAQSTDVAVAHRKCYLAAGPGSPRLTLARCFLRCYVGH